MTRGNLLTHPGETEAGLGFFSAPSTWKKPVTYMCITDRASFTRDLEPVYTNLWNMACCDASGVDAQ